VFPAGLASIAPAVKGPGLSADVLVVALAVLYWVPYHRRAGRLAREGHAVPRWRQWCYGAGLLVLVAALSTPLGVLSEKLLVAHMVEHLLIGDIGALLIVLGLTGPMLAPLLRIGLFARLRVFTRSSRCRCGRSTSTPGTSRCSTRRRYATRGSTRSSTPVSCWRASQCGWR
jgi:hypothetical protein